MRRKRRLFPIALAVLTVGLLGTCSKINERIDGLDKRIHDLENGEIASVQQQMDAIRVNITKLEAADETINGKIEELKATAEVQQSLIDALGEADIALGQKDEELEARIDALKGQVATIGGQIETLVEADKAINTRIDTLKIYVGTQIGKAKDWATVTFATLVQYEKTAEDLAELSVTVAGINATLTGVQTSINNLDTKINGIDTALQEKIQAFRTELEGKIAGLKTELEGKIADALSASETSIKSWISNLLEGYYTIAQVDAKVSALNTAIDIARSTAKERIDSVATELTTLKTEVDAAKAAIRTEYRSAIATAIRDYDGEIRGALKDSILAVNGRVEALGTRVAALEARVRTIEGRLDRIESMIQSVTILPVSADGSVEASGALLTISCIVKPADAVTDISEDSVKILISNAKTKAATSYETVAVSRLTTKDSKTGELTIKADISSVAPAPNGMAHMAAVKISSGISRYITGFYPVNTKQNATTESGDTTKVSLSADPDFPDAVSGILPVGESFDPSKPTTITVEGIGNITFNKEAAEQITENANGATSILLKVEDVTKTLANPVPDADVVIEVTMKTYDEKGDEVFSEDNAGEHSEVTIEIPMDDDVAFVKTVVLVNDKGEPIEGGVVPGSEKIENGILSFKVNHFSKYAVDYVKQKDFVSVEKVTLNKTTMTLTAGGAETLTATITPANATNQRVTWSSSNTAVATVDKDGKVTAVAAGTATITVTTEDVVKATGQPATATCSVTVSNPIVSVTGVSLNKTELTLEVGSDETLTATITPTDATNQRVTWSSSNTAVATVGNDGKVTAVAAGTATITVTTEDVVKATGQPATATCSVTVSNPIVSVTNVSLNKTTMTLEVGSDETLTATITPTDATNKNVTWSSSNEDVATVGNDGKVTAVAAGTATITVTTVDGAKTATCTVTVSNPIVSVTDVSLNKTTMTLTVGGTETLTATVAPDNASNQNVTWSSSNTAVATVGNDGKVTAVAAGTATITVTTEDGSKTATCTVTVSNPIVSVTDVSLNKTTMTLTVGGTETLTATITPTDATNKNVTWSSSNTAVATVGNDGKVTAVAAGTATITVTTEDGSKTATCTVTVSNPIVSVTNVSLNKTTMTLEVGKDETLTATITPTDATNKNVTWSSSNTDVATVGNDGKVTAVAAGTATITVTTVDGAKTATCIVTVSEPIVNVTNVSLNKTTLTLTVGESETLTATVAPDNASNQNVTWSSSNEKVATVKDGKVTAIKAGTAKITVKTEDGDKTDECTVTVSNPDPTETDPEKTVL